MRRARTNVPRTHDSPRLASERFKNQAVRWTRRNLGDVIGLAALSALVIPVIFFLILTSVRSGPPGAPDLSFSLESWRAFFSASNRTAIVNTFVISIATTLIAVPVGSLFAWLEAQTDTPFVGLLSKAFVVPLLFSPLLTTIAWTILAAPRVGILNVLIESGVGWSSPFDVYSIPGIVWVSALYFTPLAYLAVRGTARSIGADIVDAARTAGTNTTTILRRIVLPLLAPSVASAALLVFSLGIGLFAIVTLLGPQSGVVTLQRSAFFALIEAPVDHPHAATVGTFILIITAVNMGLYSRMTRRSGRHVTVSGKGFARARFALGPWRIVTFSFATAYLVIAVAMPYAAVAYAAFKPFMGIDWGLDLSTLNFRTLLDMDVSRRALRNTLILGLVGGAGTTAVAFLVAYTARVRRTGVVAKLLEGVATVPLAVPGLSFALGMLWFSLSLGVLTEYLYGSLAIIYLAQLAYFLPLAVQIVGSAFAQIGSDLEGAARLAGASSWSRLRSIVFPLVRPTVASVWIVVGLYAMVEAGLSIFLYRNASITTAVLVFNNTLQGNVGVAYAGALLLATLGLVLVVVGNRAIGRRSSLLG